MFKKVRHKPLDWASILTRPNQSKSCNKFLVMWHKKKIEFLGSFLVALPFLLQLYLPLSLVLPYFSCAPHWLYCNSATSGWRFDVVPLMTQHRKKDGGNWGRSLNYPSLQVEVFFLWLWSAICLRKHSSTVWVWKPCQSRVINAAKCVFSNVAGEGAGG